MNIVILHDAVAEDARPDEADTLVQAAVVGRALRELGHATTPVAATLDLGAVRAALRRSAPDVVFNLVESLGGTGRLIHVAPLLLEALGIPYTGSPADAVYATSNKMAAKQALAAARIPTPGWIEASGRAVGEARAAGPFIIKSVWEHASLGLSDASIVEGDARTLAGMVRARASDLGGDAFAERFIDGREFNLSVLAGPDGPTALPPAEIDFLRFGGRARIVGYSAKWEPGSHDYSNTPRRFEFPPGDWGLLRDLSALALSCWRLFRLRGYARVDFRVDAHGRPWVLEVNTNPCLSPDAGFAAALERAGVRFSEAIGRILADLPRVSEPAGSASGLRDQAGRAAPETPAESRERAFRTSVSPADAEAVRGIVESSGFFSSDEVGVAVELVEEHRARGEASGYFFVFAEQAGRVVGYACYGPIACTVASFDLYWIAVHAEHRGAGLGRRLAAEVERLVLNAGGRRLYAETSSRSQYAPTRAFYERCGYILDAEMRDFYAPGDGKQVYVRELATPPSNFGQTT